MISRADIVEYVRGLGECFKPEKIILFGSYASGIPSEDSDVDLLVIMDHDKPRNIDQAISMRLRQSARFPLDLLVRRPSEIQERIEIRDTFINDILDHGQVLYG